MIAAQKRQKTKPLIPITWKDLRMAAVVTRRESRDTLRDWRLIIPILGLTLLFPAMMIAFSGRMITFLDTYNSQVLGERSLPLLMLVVGFFPTSFSLVIALEVFVGEKERKSLEPLLSTPLTNTQLFIGKLLAAVAPPVMASYVGIAVYAVGVSLFVQPMVGQSIVLVTILTTIQAVLMVAASVVVSSQTTSTRAANMLASFIVVPVALLLQFEAYLLAFEYYGLLWLITLAVLITAVIFVRIGVQLFDREQLLGRNLDFLQLGWAAGYWWQSFSGRQQNDGRFPGWSAWLRQTVQIVPRLKLPIGVLLLVFVAASIFGVVLARWLPLPPEMLLELRSGKMQSNVLVLREMLGQLPVFIFAHNVRAIGLLVILGMLTFGVLNVLVFSLPWVIISFMTAQFAAVGENPLVFLGATILPHGWIEMPALLLVSAAALRWQMIIIAHPGKELMSERWLTASADFARIFLVLGVPMFLAAALLESFVTPNVIVWIYGG